MNDYEKTINRYCSYGAVGLVGLLNRKFQSAGNGRAWYVTPDGYLAKKKLGGNVIYTELTEPARILLGMYNRAVADDYIREQSRQAGSGNHWDARSRQGRAKNKNPNSKRGPGRHSER